MFRVFVKSYGRQMLFLLLISGWAVSAGACLELEGGAAEVAWVIRDTKQRARDCQDVDIKYVRLQVLSESDGGMLNLCEDPDTDIGRCTYTCETGRGTTSFKIPEGWYYFGLTIINHEGKEMSADQVAVPSPIYRRVLDGQILDLGVWQIVTQTEP
jgi:hypothetical protein